jgi:hypothetical protein
LLRVSVGILSLRYLTSMMVRTSLFYIAYWRLVVRRLFWSVMSWLIYYVLWPSLHNSMFGKSVHTSTSTCLLWKI